MQLHRVNFCELWLSNSGDNVAYLYLCMVTGRKSAYQSSFISQAFSNALDDHNVNGRIKIGNDLCTFDINLVHLNDQ